MPAKYPFKDLPARQDVQDEVLRLATSPEYTGSVNIRDDKKIEATRKDSGTKEVYYPTATGGKLDKFYSEIKPKDDGWKGYGLGDGQLSVEDIVDQNLTMSRRQIQQKYDLDMEQLRQMPLSDEEYYAGAQAIKNDTAVKEMEMRQQVETINMSLGHLDTLAKEGLITPDQAEAGKFKLVGVDIPKKKTQTPQEIYGKLDNYRSDLENRLSKFYKGKETKKRQWTGVGATRPFSQNLTSDSIYVVEMDPTKSGQKAKVKREATKEEQQERLFIMQELSRVRNEQINVLEQSGNLDAATAGQLRTSNRLQGALSKTSATSFYEQRANPDPLGLMK